MKYFSKTTRGFYDDELHGDNMPNDVVLVPPERFLELWDGHMLGKAIVGDAQGSPVLEDVIQISLTYAQLRETAYPPITDYLDGVVKGDQAQIQAYIDACQAIKNKYPKGK